MDAPRFRVFVVDDRELPRAAARSMLAGATDLELVGDASSGAEALRAVPQANPDVVLMDVDMAGMDGASTTRALLDAAPHLTVLAWTVSDASEDLLRMIQAGCVGYVLKDVGPGELQRAIRAAVRRETPIPRKMVPEVLERAAKSAARAPSHAVSLTSREHQALRLLAKGFALKQMAADLGIATSSADTHVRNLYRKLNVNSRAEAISTGLRLGLLTLNDM